MFSTLGDVRCVGGVQYIGGYHEYVGRYDEYMRGYHESLVHRGCSVHRRDIISTSGDVQYIRVSIEIERLYQLAPRMHHEIFYPNVYS